MDLQCNSKDAITIDLVIDFLYIPQTGVVSSNFSSKFGGKRGAITIDLVIDVLYIPQTGVVVILEVILVVILVVSNFSSFSSSRNSL